VIIYILSLGTKGPRTPQTAEALSGGIL